MRELAGDAGRIVKAGAAWWVSALDSLVPVIRSSPRIASADIVVIVKDGHIARTHPALIENIPADSPSFEDAVLQEIARRSVRRPKRVLLRANSDDCLVRALELPLAARSDVERVASLDLERTTPFKLADIFTATFVDEERSKGDAIRVIQLIIKRSKLAPVRTRLVECGAEVVGADCLGGDGQTVLPVDFLSGSAHLRSASRQTKDRVNGLFAGTAVFLALAALAITTYRHEAALRDLEQQTAAARARIEAARAVASATSAAAGAETALLRLKTARSPAVVIIEDLSRNLPDTAWVTDLKLDNETVDLAGYGRPAATLAPQLERSPFVESAALTAPIVADAERGRERFSLRLKLGTAGLRAAPSAAPSNNFTGQAGPAVPEAVP